MVIIIFASASLNKNWPIESFWGQCLCKQIYWSTALNNDFTTPLNCFYSVLIALVATGYPGTHPTGYPGTRDIWLVKWRYLIELDENFCQYAKFVQFARYYKEIVIKMYIRKKNNLGNIFSLDFPAPSTENHRRLYKMWRKPIGHMVVKSSNLNQ